MAFGLMIPQKIGTISLAGTASGCMRWLGGTTPEGRADLPAMLAPEGAAWDRVRGRSFSALLGAMAVGCVSPRWRPRALPAMAFPPRWRPDACFWDGVRGRSRCWPVQAGHAFPVTAVGCPIRARWRSGCSNHGVESGAGRSSHGSLVPAQRFGIQLPRARWVELSKCQRSRARSGLLQCRVRPRRSIAHSPEVDCGYGAKLLCLR
jgi:hypothetical protein